MKEILNNVLEVTDGCTGCGICEISCLKKWIKLNIPKERQKVINDLKTDINMNQIYKKYIRNDKLKQRIKWKIRNTFSKVMDKGLHEKR